MAEVKNSFLASKMNKDLDSRLVPNNQYRNAFNIAVSESEDSDVGALENVLGNTLIAEATSFSENASIIGYGVDDLNEKIYLFITDYTDESPTALTNNQAALGQGQSSILSLDIKNNANTFETIVNGRFLNFSTTHPIYQVNILENLLFWTDNRNQPRKINLKKAENDNNYYNNEDSISIAKYAPYKSIDLVVEENGEFSTTMKDVVSTSTIDGASGYATSIVSNDNNIPIQTTYGTFKDGDVISIIPEDLDKIPAGTTILSGSNQNNLITSQNVGVLSSINPNDIIVFSPNPDYIPDYTGDPVFLQDRFVKFSYRFKYEDNEYSTIAPFTQTAFIPQQDGYFLEGDEEASYTSGEVSFMRNKVNFIQLVINFPDGSTGSTLASDFKISEIDIIYQESNSLALFVLDTIKVQDISSSNPNDTFFKYNYQSRKPILTLPQSELNRVYDKTPVKALTQEVSGNRIIYGNYVNKHTAPKQLNYEVAASQKIKTGTLYTGLDKEYPVSTVKRNRNYQLGVVLMDRYGRESDVILSNVGSNSSANVLGNSFKANTFYFPYKDNETLGDVLSDVGSSIKIQFNEPISSTFSPLQYGNPIPTGEPGLYNGDDESEFYNPLGWYAYKIVIKQTQQEYYNVYTPGIVKGKINESSTDTGVAFTTLISDSLNKVPKELADASGNQNQFRSDTLLYCLVDEAGEHNPGTYNVQGFPGNTSNTVTTLSTLRDMGVEASNTESIFQAETNPFVAKLATPKTLGVEYANNNKFQLTVFETDPFESNLDIYYETSTSGLISELNFAILAGGGNNPIGFTNLAYTHREFQDTLGTGEGTGEQDSRYITTTFAPIDKQGSSIDDSDILSFRVVDGVGNERANGQVNNPSVNDQFELEKTSEEPDPDVYRIKIRALPAPNNGFYFGPSASTEESYTFFLSVRNNEDTATAIVNGLVTNSSTISVDNLVDGVAGNGLFPGMKIKNANTDEDLGTIQIIISGGGTGDTEAVFTTSLFLSNLPDNTPLSIEAPVVDLQFTRSLSNNDPIIDDYQLPQPQFSTMPNPFVTFTGKNGSFNTDKNTLNLTWGFSSIQDDIINDGYTFIVNNNPLIDNNATIQINRGGGTSDTVTLSIDKNTGVFGRLEGGFWSNLNIVVTLTDAGGATDETTVNLLTEPGAFSNAFSTAFDI